MYFIVYQLTSIFPVQDFFQKKDFVPDRSTWLRAISDLLPQQMIKSQLALAAILHEYEPANLPACSHFRAGGRKRGGKSPPLIFRCKLVWPACGLRKKLPFDGDS
ncbi:unnamed protein product [Haemonchus placei]|uniref:Transposase n=1 Tax=Haemonchus placei TaxID=6290 RepID=A0A158QPG7_HAEPC|nr:unnamed protein product [Haemonchus placei]